MIITEQKLIEDSYQKIDKTLYAKNVTKELLISKIENYFLYNDNTLEKIRLRKELYDLDVYKSYKEGWLHVSNFGISRKKKKTGGYHYGFKGNTGEKILVERKRRTNIRSKNIGILRLYHMGNSEKELLFKVNDTCVKMENKKVNILKEDSFANNFELHHIATINNNSRDKVDSDPNQWLMNTNLASYEEIEVTKLEFLDDKIIINDKEYSQNQVILEIKDGKIISFIKNKSCIERILELISIMIIPVDEHSVFHKSNARTETKSAGFSDYNLEALPFSLRSKQNYELFLNELTTKYKYNKSIFPKYEEHIKFLEVE